MTELEKKLAATLVKSSFGPKGKTNVSSSKSFRDDVELRSLPRCALLNDNRRQRRLRDIAYNHAKATK